MKSLILHTSCHTTLNSLILHTCHTLNPLILHTFLKKKNLDLYNCLCYPREGSLWREDLNAGLYSFYHSRSLPIHYLRVGNLMVIRDSESVPHIKVWDSMSTEFTGRMLSSIRELISIFLLSEHNHLFTFSLPPNWKDGLREKFAPPEPAPAKHRSLVKKCFCSLKINRQLTNLYVHSTPPPPPFPLNVKL